MEFQEAATNIRHLNSTILKLSECPESDIIVGATEAARFMGVSVHSVMSAAQSERILSVRIGKKLYFSRKWLIEFSKSENRFNR